MRDPQRIERIIEVLRGVWERNPDWRLGQLVHNASRPADDSFYVEDDTMEDRLWALMGTEPPSREPSIGAAWAEAEAELPRNFRLHLDKMADGSYSAEARPPFMDYERWHKAVCETSGPTPAAALRALALTLASRRARA